MKFTQKTIEENIYEKKIIDIDGIYLKDIETIYFYNGSEILAFNKNSMLPTVITDFEGTSTIKDFIIQENGQFFPITKELGSKDFTVILKC